MALSSITKKLIMSISGLFLITFLLLHMTINLFSVVDSFTGAYPVIVKTNTEVVEAADSTAAVDTTNTEVADTVAVANAETTDTKAPEYKIVKGGDGLFKAGCEFMALPFVTVMVPVLAAGFLVHILYAFILTAGNIRARGGYSRYAGGSKGKAESWAAKNMLLLGIVVLGIVAFHLSHFWYDMQYQHFVGGEEENPYWLLNRTFESPWITGLYIVWFIALGLHLCHGFWSAFQSIGMSNKLWEKRLTWIGYLVVAVIVLGFIAVAINGCLQANGYHDMLCSIFNDCNNCKNCVQ